MDGVDHLQNIIPQQPGLRFEFQTDLLPRSNLSFAPCSGIVTTSIRARSNDRRFRNEQSPGVSRALLVLVLRHLERFMVFGVTEASARREHNSVGERDVSHFHRLKEFVNSVRHVNKM